MFAGNAYGRHQVAADGTLRIQGVRREDAGFLACSALSVAGSTSVRAFLQVTSVDDVPPPIVEIGPANQTLPLQSVATLPCQVSGSPAPKVTWYKDGSPLSTPGPRLKVTDAGTLHIDDLQLGDSGLYTCTASSPSGETSWSASLLVERSPAEVHRSPDPSTFPGQPPRPRVLNVSESAATVTWRGARVRQGASALVGYSVEYFSPELQTGWVPAASRVSGDTVTIGDLKPDTSYVFLVRAENSHGLSVPSPVSDIARTLGTNHHEAAPFELDEARARLSTKVVTLKDVTSLGPTSVRLVWEVVGDDRFVDGLYVRFRDLAAPSQKYSMVTVLNAGATSHTISNLHKYAQYEFFLVPFYKSVEGQPSNSRVVRTAEDVPSAPPDNVQVGLLNTTAAFVRWSAPPPQHHNGVLQGYKIQIKGNGSKVLAQMTLNATTTSVLLNNLTTGGSYSARVAAFTRVGLGPFSGPVGLLMDPALLPQQPPRAHPSEGGDGSSSVVREPWFLVLMGAVALALAVGFVGALYARRRRALGKELGHLSVPVVSADLVNKDTSLWIDQGGWRGRAGSQLLGPTDYAEVNLSTFYSRPPAVPAPYATTTLVARRDTMENGHMFVPVNTGGPGEAKTSSSSDSCAKPDLSSLDTNPELGKSSSPSSENCSMYIVDENVMGRRAGTKLGSHQAPNWSEFLPPPPEHPPPSSLSGCHRLMVQLPNSTRGVSPQGCGPHSPLLNKRSNCSREGTPHPQPDSGGSSIGYATTWADPAAPYNNTGAYRPQHPPPVPNFPLGFGSHTQSSGARSRGAPEDGGYGEFQQSGQCGHNMDRGVQSSLPSLASEQQRNAQMGVDMGAGREDSDWDDTCCSCSESSCLYAEVQPPAGPPSPCGSSDSSYSPRTNLARRDDVPAYARPNYPTSLGSSHRHKRNAFAGPACGSSDTQPLNTEPVR